MNSIQINRNTRFTASELFIPGSKSESNRALIISALEGDHGHIENLSTARDTQTMQRLLRSKDHKLDVLDAGTTMRFLTAYLAVTNQQKTLTGTKRMLERPIKILVDALCTIGCSIHYQNKKGYPPIELMGFEHQKQAQLEVPGSISSQYISALLMVAPMLPKGLKVSLTGEVGSRPYIQMTLNILQSFGIGYEWRGDTISVGHQPYSACNFIVEPDWSGASYWYAFGALAAHDGFLLPGLKTDSLQGDRVIAALMADLGIVTEFREHGAWLTKSAAKKEIAVDFKDCPDLAQTIAVVCAAKKITGTFTGLESLKIKETNRIVALQNELSKIGARFEETAPRTYTLTPPGQLPESATIHTYDDHRMAMAFAPLASIMDITIEDPDVVEKSYPEFWDQVKSAGYTIT